MKTWIEQVFAEAAMPLDGKQIDQLAQYGELLKTWNQKINLTAIVEDESIVRKHFLDCALLSRAVPENARLLDIGSGAGFPGMVLAVVRPDLQIDLLDSLQKRTRFQTLVKETLSLENLRQCIHGRAEVLAHEPAFREQYEVVTSRAVASLPLLMELSAAYICLGGRLLAMKGPYAGEEVKAIGASYAQVGLDAPTVQSYMLPKNEERSIVAFHKTASTPLRYPRRPKAMERKPLGM